VRAARPRCASAIVIVAAGLWCASASSARELWSHGDASVEFSGSLRQIALYNKQTDATEFQETFAANLPECLPASAVANCPAWDGLGDTDVGQALTRLRLRFDLRATSWLSAVVEYDNQAVYGLIDTVESTLGVGFEEETLFGAEGIIQSSEHVLWTQSLYRGYAQAEGKGALVRVGRQKIAWGVGNLWNPIDRFAPIPPLAIQGDQYQGIDAVLARWGWSGFDFVEAVAAPGRSVSDSRYAAHAHVVLYDTDISLMGGYYREAPTVGFDFARNLGDAAVYLEAVWAKPEQSVWRIGDPGPAPPDDFWQVVFGVHNMFDVGTGLYVLIEHLYNGNALGFGEGKAGTYLNFFEQRGAIAVPATNAIAGSSGVVTFAEHQTGLQLGYDITPEVRSDLLIIYDWNGQSAAFYPNFSYAAFDFLDLRLGAQFFAGKRLSEYGARETLVYFLADVFF
jgi:hypothetical protein